MMNPARTFSFAVKILLLTALITLFLNFACAQGAGVKILSWLGYVESNHIHLKENILSGVAFMQTIIKIIATVGLLISLYYLVTSLRMKLKSL